MVDTENQYVNGRNKKINILNYLRIAYKIIWRKKNMKIETIGWECDSIIGLQEVLYKFIIKRTLNEDLFLCPQ